MQPLPIDAVLPELCQALLKNHAVVVEAPPGAGKTTRVPRALLEAGLAGERAVVVTEPRRLAARLAARRVADEYGERVGETVGYRVRFEDVTGPRTRIVYVTEGVLLQRWQVDRGLSSVGVIVLDEFHERHLETDLLLALLAQRIQEQPGSLKLVVMSATLDAQPIAGFLGHCPRIRSEGRLFPVSIEHLAEPDDRPLSKQVVSAVRRLRNEGTEGDVLVFLPGAAEIRRSQAALEGLAAEQTLLVTPLHGDLPIAEQARAIEPASRPKVVLATNVAESSVTIEGVAAVIDSGLVRRAGHSPWTGLPTLSTEPVSRASSIQRAGRAGRLRPGRVLRLYTRGEFQSRPEFDVPEVTRSDLTECLLFLHGLGANAAKELAWLTPPPDSALKAAEELLAVLGAIDSHGTLTKIGRRLLELPVHPRLGRVLVEGEHRGVAQTAALAVALLGEREIRLSQREHFDGARARPDVTSGPSDLLELVDAFELARSLNFEPRRLRAHQLDARSIEAVARAERQLLKLLRTQAPSTGGTSEREAALLIATLSGFADRLARRSRPGGADLVLASGATARLSPSSVVTQGELLVAIDVEERIASKRADATVRLASSVRPEWLLDLFSDRITLSDELSWNSVSERVEQISRMTFGAVVLDETRSPAPLGPKTALLLLRASETRGAQQFGKSDSLLSLGERLALLRQHAPQSGLPPLEPRAVLARACEQARSFDELRHLDLGAIFLGDLSEAQRKHLERDAPERVRLPGGRNVQVHYDPGKPPWIESRLQDFFGMSDGPRLCNGRVPVTLHLLAPNGRAVQVTTDLRGFWERHYPALRRELMRRYPRHAWPENGASAEPPKRKT